MRIFFLVLFSLSLNFSSVFGQDSDRLSDNAGFQLSEVSPLRKLSTKDLKVTPASFLQENGKSGAASPSLDRKAQEDIPSILTGRKNEAAGGVSVASRQQPDPLNIPSEPITRKDAQPLPDLEPPSSFVPPKKVQSSVETPSATRAPAIQPLASSFAPRSQPVRAQKTEDESKLGPPKIADRRNQVNPRFIRKEIAEVNVRSAEMPIGSKSGNDASQPVEKPLRIRNTGPINRIPNNAATRLPATPTKPPAAELSQFTEMQMSPQLRVMTTGPKTISVDKPGAFNVKVSNLGNLAANEVILGIEIPAWVEIIGTPSATGGVAEVKSMGDAKGIVWTLSYLPGQQDALVSLTLMPRENRAFQLKTEWTTAPISGAAKVMVTQPKLATRIMGPDDIKYGEKAVYTITIENTGNGAAEKVGVSLSETLGGDSASVGTIAAGATKQFEVELTAGESGPLKLEAFVNGDAGVKSGIAKEVLVRRAKLLVTAKAPKFKYAGSALTYNVTVENTGDATAEEISAASLVPLGAEYISGLSNLLENTNRNIRWNIGDLPAGSKREFIITCLIQQAGDATMEIGVRSKTGLTAGDVVTTKVEALADLTLEVVDPRGPQGVGREVVYELLVKNRGTKAATNVLVSGEFSDHIEPVAGKGVASRIEPGVISFTAIPKIDVGESVSLKVVAKAFQPGTHTFRAIVECKAQDIRRIAEGTTKFFGEGIQPTAQSLPSAVSPSDTKTPTGVSETAAPTGIPSSVGLAPVNSVPQNADSVGPATGGSFQPFK
ncbi:hypothetical protein OAG56_01795 [Mariniblastus sp.]|nr:CARDB domain-containing protein [Mariniblastus sp.]MDB4670931.1 hypothetical protein [Pirellulaceae bacterium]MDB4756077.1 hypothetical protein [Mariniblastus sp.]